MNGVWYYYWDEGNYCNGYVIGFKTESDAAAHAVEHHENTVEDIIFLEAGEVLDINSG